MLTRKTALLLLLAFLTRNVFAQDYKTNPGYRFTKEELHEIYLDKSKDQKKKAFIALSAGPVLTGIGIYIVNKSGPKLIPAGGGFYAVRSSNGELIGGLIGATGILTTASSIPLFISSTKYKKKAALLLTDQTTSYTTLKIFVPSFTVAISL